MNRIKLILESKKGYRNNEYFGEGYTDFKDVLAHEIGGLCNVDILQTLKELYPGDFSETKQAYMTEAAFSSINSGVDNKEDTIRKYVEDIHAIVQGKLNTQADLKVIWVCAVKDDVNDNYSFSTSESDDDDTPINTVIFNEPFLIISNLEDEGLLVATTAFEMY